MHDANRPPPYPHGNTSARLSSGLITALIVAAVALLLLVPERGAFRGPVEPLQAAYAVQLEEADREDLVALDRAADVAAYAREAVVRIESRTAAPASPTMQLPEPLERFFGPDAEMPDPTPRIAGGSGFIVSPDGRILTNAHVVRNGDALTVWLDDRRSFPAEVVGVDPTTDVAVLDIQADGLPTIPFADSDALRVGDWVLAIGSPGVGGGQLEQTVTAGIVSALVARSSC